MIFNTKIALIGLATVVSANFSIDSSTGLLKWQGGYVCDDYFNSNAGKMICNTVKDQDFKSYRSKALPNGSRDFRMDDLKCPDNADRLSDCTHSTVNNCYNSEGVYLECQPRSFSIEGGLLGGLLKYGDGYVCDDIFGYDEAVMACKEMNMRLREYRQQRTVPRPYFTMDQLNCPLMATDRSQCTYDKQHNCGTSEGVYLSCHSCCNTIRVRGIPSPRNALNGVYYMTNLPRHSRPVYYQSNGGQGTLYFNGGENWHIGTSRDFTNQYFYMHNPSKFVCPTEGNGPRFYLGSGWQRDDGISIECERDVPHAYIGCYVDDADRDLEEGPKQYGYDPDSCAEACEGYKYFALQNNGWCVCGNDYATASKYSKVADSDCGSSRRGGAWRNAVFVQLTGGSDEGRPFEVFGDCERGNGYACEAAGGWLGTGTSLQSCFAKCPNGFIHATHGDSNCACVTNIDKCKDENHWGVCTYVPTGAGRRLSIETDPAAEELEAEELEVPLR